MNEVTKIIKTDKEHEKALERLEEVFDAPVGTPEGDESELLALLIEKYEEDHYPIPDPDPIEAVKYMMEQSNLKPKDLAQILGDKGNVSKILNKRRKLNLDMIRKLHDFLKIPYSVLLQDYSLKRI